MPGQACLPTAGEACLPASLLALRGLAVCPAQAQQLHHHEPAANAIPALAALPRRVRQRQPPHG